MSLSIRPLPRLAAIALSAAALATAGALPAQQRSQSYTFLEAVRSGEGAKVTEMLNQPGQTIINTKDRSTGEGALHITAKRGDAAYTRFLLSRGANPDIQDMRGNTPAMLAVERGAIPVLEALTGRKANLNVANQSGETPLIRAVQLRNLDMVRILLAAGADPRKADVIAGLSARDYAERDTRTPALLREIDNAPKAKPAAVAGPRL